jgi:hypothetical protein
MISLCVVVSFAPLVQNLQNKKHAHHVVESLPLVSSMEQRAHGLGVLWTGHIQPKQTRGVSHCDLVIYIKMYL